MIKKCCSNYSITRIQKRKNRDKNKYQRKKKIGNNISDRYNLLLRNKMESYKMNNTSKRKTKNEIECVRTVSHGGNA